MISAAAVFCLAQVIYHEARGEPERGQVAVAHVVLNRAGWKSERVCDVARQRGRFSPAYRVRDAEQWYRMKQVTRRAWCLRDTVRGATFFHGRHMRPRWIRGMVQTARIGRHIFWRPRRELPGR